MSQPLPEDMESLQAMVRALWLDRERAGQERAEEQKRMRALELDLLRLSHQIDWFRKRYYGPRADRLEGDAALGQMLLEFSAELEQRPVNRDDAPAGPSESDSQLRRVKKRRGRRNLAKFEALPERIVVHELSPAERACVGCGAERQEIGQEESWQLEFVPGHFERLHHLRKKYGCAGCEQRGEGPKIEAAAKPAAAIERGLAGPGLLAYIVTSKFADYLPLYRLEDVFERLGCEVSRATMSVWCGDCADLVEPLYQLMAGRVRQARVIGTDDTPMPMQDPGAGQARTARMWIYRGDDSQPYNVFDFTLSRKRDGPARFLQDYRQTIVADAYGGYNGVVAGNQITRAGCWAHARRKFLDAEKLAPDLAREAVARIGSLFRIEAQAATADAATRLRLRQEQSVPVLAALERRLLDGKRELLPKHLLAEAIGYVLNQWDELNVFVRDGEVPIENNAAEREMKRQVLNRKNSLFVGNPRGGRTAAILSSLSSTCRRHGVDPQLYFTQLLLHLPAWPTRELADWLPDQWKLRQAALPNPPA
ncbi:MAG TPA: IS66 family transposase [Terriglobales bacterium]|nr:IS66 family transposase [Terriglobales bacterium]